VHQPAITPEETVDRTKRLVAEYGELRTDLLDEVNMVDERMIKPAVEARDYLQPMKKIIKKREDKKVRDDILRPVALMKPKPYSPKIGHHDGSILPINPMNIMNLKPKNISNHDELQLLGHLLTRHLL
jgi:hypothetical protein